MPVKKFNKFMMKSREAMFDMNNINNSLNPNELPSYVQ